MKKFILLLLCFIPLFCFSQKYQMYKTQNYHNQLMLNTATGSVKQVQDDGQSWVINEDVEPEESRANRFRLYETSNMWTFLLLDTYQGKIWQVQYSVKGEDYMFSFPIRMFSLAYASEESIWTDRFQLFATQNMWTFILLDSYEGRLWQVQYNTKDLDNVFCIPINDTALVESSERSLFSIQPMTSMYQYYLVKDDTGEMWQFQWTTKGPDYRWIKKVY